MKYEVGEKVVLKSNRDMADDLEYAVIDYTGPKNEQYLSADVVGGHFFDKDINHEKTADLHRGEDMRYKTGDKVVLRDDLVVDRNYGDGAVVFIKEMEGYVGEVEEITHLVEEENLYAVNKRWLISEDMIDHDKTAELNNPTHNHYSNELEKIVAEKNGHEVERADAIEPPHYNSGEIDLIESWYLTMPFDGFRWAMKSHIHKYIYRYEQKGGVEDLDKMMFFAERLKEYELKEKEEEHA